MLQQQSRWLPVFAGLLLTIAMAGCIGGFSPDTGGGVGLCGLVIIVLDVLAILEIAGSSRNQTAKAVWILMILLVPVIGLIVYYFVGR